LNLIAPSSRLLLRWISFGNKDGTNIPRK